MSFDDRLIHALIIERSTAGVVDDYNQPSQAWTTVATVKGLVQPKDMDEVAQLNEAGAVISDHRIYLLPTDVKGADRIRFDPDDGRRYQIVGVRDEAGIGHHLRVDARMVQP